MVSEPYVPYRGLISLQNSPLPVDTGFNWRGHAQFFENRYTIIDKQKQEVPFKQNFAQLDLLYHMSLYYQIVILKARKMGFSSSAIAVAAEKFLLGKNEHCVSMSFDAGSSSKILERAKHYIDSYQRKKGIKLNMKYNSRNEMMLKVYDPETGETSTNTFRVGTAKSSSFGRGDDITFLHLTEVAHCDDVEALLAGVGEACLPNTYKLLETTANGFNSYQRFYQAAKNGENDFAVLFYSPFWEYSEEYVMQKRQNLKRLGPQEYPLDDAEAFLTSGDCYFDMTALRYYMEHAREVVHV